MNDVDVHHRAERLSHALYGLIIITATLVAEKEHIEEPEEALGLLAATSFVLLLAHTYSAWMAERIVESSSLGTVGRRMVVADNLPLLAAILLPAVLFGLSWADVLTMKTAYTVSIIFSVATLVGLGLYQGALAGMGRAQTILGGLAAGAIGLIVVAVEAFFD